MVLAMIRLGKFVVFEGKKIRKMKYIFSLFSIASLLVAISSCSSDSDEIVENNKVKLTFDVYTPESNDTRAYTNAEDFSTIGITTPVKWQADDLLSVYAEGVAGNNQFSIKHIDKQENIASVEGEAAVSSFYCVIYPWVEGDNYDIQNECFNVTIKPNQKPTVNSFDDTACFWAGKTIKNSLMVQLDHVCGFLRVHLPENWKSFTVANDDENSSIAIAGDISIQLDRYGYGPSIKYWKASSKSITITPTTAGESGYYLIALLPGTFQNGLALTAELDKTTKTRRTNTISIIPGSCYDLGTVVNPTPTSTDDQSNNQQ